MSFLSFVGFFFSEIVSITNFTQKKYENLLYSIITEIVSFLVLFTFLRQFMADAECTILLYGECTSNNIHCVLSIMFEDYAA